MKLLKPLLFFCVSVNATWFHLELGAGNYGTDGYTQTAIAKTVSVCLKKFPSVFIEVPKHAQGLDTEKQFGLLFDTLTNLVRDHGPDILFHVNDLVPEYAFHAAQVLKQFAIKQGFTGVRVKALPGDYSEIDAKAVLSKYGRDKYDSAHLKNPECSLYFDTIMGDCLASSIDARIKARLLLKKLANLSKNGLELFIGMWAIPTQELKSGFFSKATQDPLPYFYPNGERSTYPTFALHICGPA